MSRALQLTDAEIISMALKSISSYAAEHPKGTFNHNDCLQSVRNAVKNIFYHYSIPENFDDAYNRISEQLMQRASKRIQSIMKLRKVSEFNSRTAKILLSDALQERGMTYSLEMQTYRARVYIQMEKRVFSFIVKYDAINSGMLDEIMDSIKNIMDQVLSANCEVEILRTRYKKFLVWSN